MEAISNIHPPFPHKDSKDEKICITKENAFLNIKKVLDHPFDSQMLALEKDVFYSTSFLQSMQRSCFSWFFSYDKTKKQDLFCLSLKRILAFSDTEMDEEQKIIKDKILKLCELDRDEKDNQLGQKNSWFFPLPIDTSALIPIDPNRITPLHTESDYQELAKEGKKVPDIRGKQFFNNQQEDYGALLRKSLRLLFPGTFQKASSIDPKDLVSFIPPKAKSEELVMRWLGHSTLLMQVYGKNILIDPIFGFVFPCYRRLSPPPIPIKDLPLIDLLLISHNHGDHMDNALFDSIGPYAPYAFVPSGLGDYFKEKGWSQIVENKWWSKTSITIASSEKNRSITLTALPAIHWSQPLGKLKGNESHWVSWMIEFEEKKIFFAGDTAYDRDLFLKIKEVFGSIDLAFLPIAPEREEETHMDHIQALEAFEDLGADILFPIHCSAYRMGPERVEEPAEKFFDHVKDKNLEDRVMRVKIGEEFSLSSSGYHVNVDTKADDEKIVG